jgi:hypothetical protein
MAINANHTQLPSPPSRHHVNARSWPLDYTFTHLAALSSPQHPLPPGVLQAISPHSVLLHLASRLLLLCLPKSSRISRRLTLLLSA